ncbi:MAG: hypothetical protein ABSH20_25935 [Tepidisphaeraceae bacterium]|jgi:hypothetical protein
MTMRTAIVAAFVLLGSLSVLAAGPSLEVKLPAGTKIKSGVATCPDLKLETQGVAGSGTIKFENLLPSTKYDVIITLEDGTILRGVDMGWYLTEKKPKQAEPLDDEDKTALRELFDGIQAFENKRNMLLFNGNQDRATVLAELIRDNGFYANKGTEVIWRIELWYFKNQHGGWEKVQQQNQVLYRERFKTRQEYDNTVKKYRYLPELGGLKFAKDEALRTIEVDPAKKSPMADVPPPPAK